MNKTTATTTSNHTTVHNDKPVGAALTVPFMLLSVLFVVCLIVSNLIEIKTVDLGWFTITAGVIVFPVSYIINDCVVEVYGFRKARLMIWVGFAMSLLVAIFLNIAIALPGGVDWHGQESMELVYGSVPRIMVASFAAFVCGSMVNAYVMSKMKADTSHNNSMNSKKNFSVRAIASTLWGESVDSIVFFPIAFGGVLPTSTIVSLILTQALLKTAYEMMVLPVTIHVVSRLKQLEKLDTVDAHIDYRWWRIRDIG
jgi:hypothetical protein